MKTTHLLLPFTYGRKMSAPGVAARFTHDHHAILVSIALITPHQQNTQRVWLGSRQQAQNVWEVVSHKVARSGVSTMQREVITPKIVSCILEVVFMKSRHATLFSFQHRQGLLSGGMGVVIPNTFLPPPLWQRDTTEGFQPFFC